MSDGMDRWLGLNVLVFEVVARFGSIAIGLNFYQLFIFIDIESVRWVVQQ
jgi:hypothetical protein